MIPKFKRREPSIITRADRARDAGQWQLAADLYRIALDRTPKNAPIWIQYGHALKEAGHRLEAESAYRAALTCEPENSDAHLQLGHVLKLQGKTAEARVAYSRALLCDGSSTEAARELTRLGGVPAHIASIVDHVAYKGNVRAVPAEVTLDRTDEPPHSKRRKETIITRADRALALGQDRLAARLYRAALDRDPNKPAIWVQYGHALKALGYMTEAETAYRTAIAYNPAGADSYVQLGDALRVQEKEGAEAAYLRALVLDCERSEPLRALRDLGWSEPMIRELVNLSNDSPPPTLQPDISPTNGTRHTHTQGVAAHQHSADLDLRKPATASSGEFDVQWYLARYPDVARSGTDPLSHFLAHGMKEGRARNAAEEKDQVSIEDAARAARADCQSWTLVTDATIRCLKQPSFGDEVGLLVTHSADGRLKRHVLNYVRSLTRESIAVTVIVAADSPFIDADEELASVADGIFVRDNEGYDFAAWAHALRLHPELYAVKALYLLNDSIIGPLSQTAFHELLDNIRTNAADLIGLTESHEKTWHIQTYFVVLRPCALSSTALRNFVNSIVSYKDKAHVILDFELRLARILIGAGFKCEALFEATDFENPTTHHWNSLIRQGFPFIKVSTIGGDTPSVEISDMREALRQQGYDIALAETALDGQTVSRSFLASTFPINNLVLPEREEQCATYDQRNYLSRQYFNINPLWVKQRYATHHFSLVSEAETANRAARRRILGSLGVDFSPFISVQRLQEQFPDYDFQSDVELTEFIEGRSREQYISPHWLYDDEFYQTVSCKTRSTTKARLRPGFFDFILHGMPRALRPHPLFNDYWYRACRGTLQDVPFVDFLMYGVVQDLSPSPLFDAKFYRSSYPEAEVNTHDGSYSCSLEHFLMRGISDGLLPSADWDPDYYLAQNADVAEAIKAGTHRSAFDHWINFGIRENRAPNSHFDGRYYLETYPGTTKELREYNLLGAFEHFAIFGRQRGWRARAPLHTVRVPLEHAKALYMKRCELSVFGVRTQGPISFPQEDKPFFSVIVSAYNNFRYNIRVLELLEHAVHYTKSKLGLGIEIVVVDNGSSDETVELENYAKGIVFRSVSPNIGFPRACNLGASLASGDYLVFLNNDVEFEPDVFVRLHAAISSDRGEVACFGAAILQFDGTLQDLGSAIFRNGVAQGYFRNEPPMRYEYAYSREVDYVAGCFFCISASEFRAFEGFDEDYSPGYYEESDLAFRLSESGRKSRVYPDIHIYHLEFGAFSSGTTPRASMALMNRNRLLFAEKHRDLLATRSELNAAGGYSQRNRNRRPRILFIEDTVPSVRVGAGFARSEAIIRVLLHSAHVDLFAVRREDFTLIPEDFEYLRIGYGPSAEDLYRTLEETSYDAVYICRTPNLARYEGVLTAWKLRTGGKIILDTEAITAIRDTSRLTRAETYAAITGTVEFQKRIKHELRSAAIADLCIAVNNFEADLLRQQNANRVHVIGHYMAANRNTPGLRERRGLLFFGSLHGNNLLSPNYDSLVWFLAHVWPKIRAQCPAEQLRIVGFVRQGMSLEPLRHEGVVHVGPVADPTNEFARARVVIAPTRFAAGVPLKVQEALSHGVPVVASRLIAEQLAYTGGDEHLLLSSTVNDDGQSFAEACVSLLHDADLWIQKRITALDYITRCCPPDMLAHGLNELLRDVDELPPSRLQFSKTPRRLDLRAWEANVELVDPKPVAVSRPIGIFVHIFFEELASEIAGYLADFKLPKRIYISTGSERKRDVIINEFERQGLRTVVEVSIVPNHGADIAPLLIEFGRKLASHDLCLKIHGKRSVHSAHEFGENWRRYLYQELMGGADRILSIVNTMLALPDLGILIPKHWLGIQPHLGTGPNFDKMQKVLIRAGIDLPPEQQSEFPSGSMFWFRSEILSSLVDSGFDWDDFGHAALEKDGNLEHAIERSFLFFSAHAGKKWGFLPISADLRSQVPIAPLRHNQLETSNNQAVGPLNSAGARQVQ